MNAYTVTLTHHQGASTTRVFAIGPVQTQLATSPEPDGMAGVLAAAALYAHMGYDVAVRRAR